MAEKIVDAGIKVWYDDFTLKWGDSLRKSIDKGLSNCRYGVVVFSKHFFQKEWPQYELDGLLSREIDGEEVILPIWYNITKEELLNHTPSFTGRLAKDTRRDSIPEIIKELKSLL